MICKLNTKQLEPEDRPESILYATHDFIIYKERNKLKLASCDGELLSECSVAIDYLSYRCLDLEDAILFLFNGSTIIVLDKNGMMPVEVRLDPIRVGKCITKIYKVPHRSDQIVFGTMQSGRIQFVNFDFMQGTRVAQTSSWRASTVTDTCLSEGRLYAVLDASTILELDALRGETLWTRFETADIKKGLITYDKYLAYACQDMLKLTDGKEVRNIRIPLVNVSSVICSDRQDIIFTSNDRKNVCSYDTVSNQMKWEISGREPIDDWVMLRSTDNTELLAVQTSKYISFIDITQGKAEYNVRTGNIGKIRRTGDHFLIQKTTGTSTLVPGVME